MDAKEYYDEYDSEYTDVIIEAQQQLYANVTEALNNKGYGTSKQEVEDAVQELCRITLS